MVAHPAGAKLPAQVVFHVQTVGWRRRSCLAPCFGNWGAILRRALAQLIACLRASNIQLYINYLNIISVKGVGKICHYSKHSIILGVHMFACEKLNFIMFL